MSAIDRVAANQGWSLRGVPLYMYCTLYAFPASHVDRVPGMYKQDKYLTVHDIIFLFWVNKCSITS